MTTTDFDWMFRGNLLQLWRISPVSTGVRGWVLLCRMEWKGRKMEEHSIRVSANIQQGQNHQF
ncbi:hypothetical protein POX_a01517 [Penicillium oxalicum]|uniref:Uncharacterized protein n=1 Tax=Penicillium oxalicum (strain 114-2 / CGMCC 5302) TaxID=933388 RepID=S7ZXJ1_PENO1|nr:hypothetical protein POX_a01517 [Penicillium oxalicum]EPS33491.1 hypothetical protein PDE_08453 [Penicillium oxalicum 114-2]KAI2794916.1 hypothetical protein POX_a01517 [Penicillium oxalicum]